MKRVCAAIPSYNCAGHIAGVITGLTPDILERLEYVLVIDNRSDDATFENAKEAAAKIDEAKIRVVRNETNIGLGGTFKRAFEDAATRQMDFLIFLHGDGQADTREVTLFLDAIANAPETAAFLGSRFMKTSKLHNYSPLRKYANLAFNSLFSFLTGTDISEIGSGLNAYNVKRIGPGTVANLPAHIAFDAELLLNMITRKLTIRFIPISWSEKGQVSTTGNFDVGFKVLRSLLAWRLGLLK